MKKRIFSRVLALFMALSLLTTTVFAASLDDLQDAIDGTKDQTAATDTVDASPVPQPDPDTPEPSAEPPVTDSQEEAEPPAEPERTPDSDETHVNGALVRTDEDGTNYFGYGWSSVTEGENKTWYYAIEAHDEQGNRYVVLLDDVSKGNGEGALSGVVIKADKDNPSKVVDIDMNSHEIKGDSNSTVITVETDAKLDLSNGTISGGQIGIDVLGTLTLDNVTVTKNGTGIKIRENGKVTFNGDNNKADVELTVGDKTYRVDAATAKKLQSAEVSEVEGKSNYKLATVGNEKIVLYTGNGTLNRGTVNGILNSDSARDATGFLIPEGVTAIDGETFKNQGGRLQTINIPSSVTEIGRYAFAKCSVWTSDIGSLGNVTKIGELAFDGCEKVTGNLTFNALSSLGEYAFRGCKSITGLSFSNACKLGSIPNQAFTNCSSLGKVEISCNVTSIAGGAFNGCKLLTTVTLPESVVSIGENAFLNCSELKTLHPPDALETIGISAFRGCCEWNEDISSLVARMKKIETKAFNGCSKVTGNLVFSSEIISLGDCVFEGCERITSVSFSSDCALQAIPRSAFRNCSGLTGKIEIPDDVTVIGVQAFSGCSKLEEITLPDGVNSIGDWAFSRCTVLKTITIPTSVATLGNGVFNEVDLKSIFITPNNETDEAKTAKLLLESKDVNIFVKEDDANLTFYRGKVTADFGHSNADNGVKLEDGSVALTNVNGTITTNKGTFTLPNVAGIIASIDTDGKITIEIPEGGEEYPYGATVRTDPDDPEGEIVVDIHEAPPVELPEFTFDSDATGADTSTTIEDEEVPLAGLVTLAELLEALREYEGIEDVELPEDFHWIDHDYAQAIYWGLQEALVVDTEDDPLDPDEIVTVALLREVLENFVEYTGVDLTVTVEGEDDMIVMDLGERLTVFYGELEAALEGKAA